MNSAYKLKLRLFHTCNAELAIKIYDVNFDIKRDVAFVRDKMTGTEKRALDFFLFYCFRYEKVTPTRSDTKEIFSAVIFHLI